MRIAKIHWQVEINMTSPVSTAAEQRCVFGLIACLQADTARTANLYTNEQEVCQ